MVPACPVVIRNAPLLDDGTPMPTRYWLVGAEAAAAVGRLEAAGGVRRAEADVAPEAVADAHARYAAERDAAVPAAPRRPHPERRGGRHPDRRQVPPRPLRLVPGGRRRPRGPMGRRPAGRRRDREPIVRDRRGGRHRFQRGPPPRSPRRRHRHPPLRDHPAGRRARAARDGSRRTRSSEPRACSATYRRLIDEHGPGVVRVVATAAARTASNVDELLDHGRGRARPRPEVLSAVRRGSAELRRGDGRRGHRPTRRARRRRQRWSCPAARGRHRRRIDRAGPRDRGDRDRTDHASRDRVARARAARP